MNNVIDPDNVGNKKCHRVVYPRAGGIPNIIKVMSANCTATCKHNSVLYTPNLCHFLGTTRCFKGS